jgi:FMN phosphatase YigB (HAD superfamily)
MKTAVIYDLDDTIMPTRGIPQYTFEPVFEAVRIANNDHLQTDVLDKAFAELWRKPLDVVAFEYGFTVEMVNECRNALINTDYKLAISPFDDFEAIKQIEGMRLLVTTGITKLQQAKIDALFKWGDFDEIIIDDPYLDNRLGKKKIFAMLSERYQLKPEQVWVVGDNPDSEIAAGNELGMNTVQILRPGVEPSNEAKFTINSFYELKGLIK